MRRNEDIVRGFCYLAFATLCLLSLPAQAQEQAQRLLIDPVYTNPPEYCPDSMERGEPGQGGDVKAGRAALTFEISVEKDEWPQFRIRTKDHSDSGTGRSAWTGYFSSLGTLERALAKAQKWATLATREGVNIDKNLVCVGQNDLVRARMCRDPDLARTYGDGQVLFTFHSRSNGQKSCVMYRANDSTSTLVIVSGMISVADLQEAVEWASNVKLVLIRDIQEAREKEKLFD